MTTSGRLGFPFLPRGQRSIQQTVNVGARSAWHTSTPNETGPSRMGGRTMPLYLTRFSYTPETWARLIGNPEDRRLADAGRRGRMGPGSPRTVPHSCGARSQDATTAA